MSGAGRRVTRRSPSARRRRATSAAASSRAACAKHADASSRSPIASSAVASRATTSSTASRSASERHAVSRATMVAFHSVMRPARQADHVCGSSRATTFASPRCCRPRCGDSRRASATCCATPAPCRDGRTPASACTARCESSSSRARCACAAVTTQPSRSRACSASTRSPSSRPLPASSAPDRAAAHSSMPDAPSTACRPERGRSAGSPRRSSNMCSIVRRAGAEGKGHVSGHR